MSDNGRRDFHSEARERKCGAIGPFCLGFAAKRLSAFRLWALNDEVEFLTT